ncbi:transcriptional regulator [Marinobacter adhaerens]|uniref:Transcriptional regulator n=1 Tax=Marinobacter adhaerens TaxID=1033846 RepID=A0A851I0U2_9GAMM|nr:PaaX family transcriptional regulator C-terminal domain-containing protein [Marinobacter adhaerens]NWN91791.1 transcriptional regulator [Marinobacter adhaerens]
MTSDDTMCNEKSALTGNQLVLDLLATHPNHELSVSSLCQAGAIVGLTEQTVRVALSRLVKERTVTSPTRGYYAWNPTSNSLFLDVENWISKERRSKPWHGSWVGVQDSGVYRRNKKQWRAHERALKIRGFEQLFEGLSVRPDNLIGGVGSLRKDLQSLGLATEAHVFGVCNLSEPDEKAARALWDKEAMLRDYKRLINQVSKQLDRLESLPPETAAAESLIFGRSVIRQIIRDPLLPEELLPGKQRLKLISLMQEYQTVAIKIWLQVLGE